MDLMQPDVLKEKVQRNLRRVNALWKTSTAKSP